MKKPGRKRQRRASNGNDSKIHLAGVKKMCRAECSKRMKEMEVITIRSRRRICHEDAARRETIQEVREDA